MLGGNAGPYWMDSIDIFRPADGNWRAGPTMPSVRGYGAAAILGRNLFVAGGGDGGNWLSSMLRLSLDDGLWSEVGIAWSFRQPIRIHPIPPPPPHRFPIPWCRWPPGPQHVREARW